MTQSIPLVDLAPLHREVADGLDTAWRAVTRSGRFVGGEFVEQFEAQWAAFCGVDHCVGVSDGTAAIELALRALGIGAGDEVIVPANTFIATWEAVAAVGATPVPVDVDPDTLLMTASAVLAAHTPRTAAAIAVHMFGQPVDMDELSRVAARLNIALIEDAAQAHGATWRGKRAGSLGDIGCFSFYPSKNLGALGDGGAVVTRRADLAARVRSLGNHGRVETSPDEHVLVGSNRRLDAIQAAFLSVKLPRLDAWNDARRGLVDRYRGHLAGTAARMVRLSPNAVSANHLLVVEVPQRSALRKALAAEGIATGIHYAIPCHLQPAFAHLPRSHLPVAEAAAERILSLPLSPHMSAADVDRVGATLVAELARITANGPSAATGRAKSRPAVLV